jgi:hypothetical protein
MKSKYVNYPCIQKKRYEVFENGIIYDHKLKKNVPCWINSTGYYSVGLYGERNGIKKTRTFSLHRIVASTFLDNKHNFPMVNHIDGNKLNPSVTNLEWCTAYHNNSHAIKTGLRRVGEECPVAKNTNETVERICQMLEDGERVKDIASKLDIPVTTVQNIKNRTCWKSISCNYTFSTKKNIDIEMARNICEYLELGYNISEVSELLSVPKPTVRNIRSGLNWTDISCEYDFHIIRHIDSKLAEDICTMLEKGIKVSVISKQLDIPASKIYNIKYKASWVEISKKYNF